MTINMAQSILKIAVWKEGEYFVSQCLNVDVSSFGKTKNEAIDNLEEALELYFDDTKTPKVAKIEQAELVSLSVKHD